MRVTLNETKIIKRLEKHGLCMECLQEAAGRLINLGYKFELTKDIRGIVGRKNESMKKQRVAFTGAGSHRWC